MLGQWEPRGDKALSSHIDRQVSMELLHAYLMCVPQLHLSGRIRWPWVLLSRWDK